MKTLKTKDIFKKGDLFDYLDPAISLLPNTFEEKKGTYTSVELGKPMTFAEMESQKPEILTLGDVYHAITSGQCLEDSWSNFFFVRNNKGNVSVVYVYRHDGRWYVHVNRLDSANRWCAANHVFLRNYSVGHSESGSVDILNLRALEKRVAKLESILETVLNKNLL